MIDYGEYMTTYYGIGERLVDQPPIPTGWRHWLCCDTKDKQDTRDPRCWFCGGDNYVLMPAELTNFKRGERLQDVWEVEVWAEHFEVPADWADWKPDDVDYYY